MGYRRKQRTYYLVFEKGALAGFEMRTRVPGLDQIDAITDMATIDLSDGRPPTKQDVQRLRTFCEALAFCLTEWNLEDEDGTPIPCTQVNLLAQDIEFLLPLAMGWLDALNSSDFANRAEQTPAEIDDPDWANLPMQLAT